VKDQIHILGISGSLRKNSNNSGLLRAAGELLPEGMALEIFDISAIPLYNNDLLAEGLPPAVQEFKARIAAADALLIATPEYNYSIPGVLKNAIDWASRPPNESSFPGKPLAMMGAGGVMGTSRAQSHLRQIASGMNMLVLNKPEVMVQRAWEKFDQHGNLTDDATRQKVKELLLALQDWTLRLRGS
jgi:chromate reductase, NAD(P)H dehydrogenase (quinone)